MKAILALEDGTTFEGSSIGSAGTTTGEMCCDTSVMGYQEILTDPASNGRVLVMTYPLIGNYGICEEDNESDAPCARGLIVTELARLHSNWRATEGMGPWLERHNIVGIAGIDTRKIATLQRNKGTLRCCITTELSAEEAVAAARAAATIEGSDLATPVSTSVMYHWEGESRAWKLPNKTQNDLTTHIPLPAVSYKVVVYDLGVRRSTLRRLRQAGFDVTVVPLSAKAEDVLALRPDAVVLSDGPGDPAAIPGLTEEVCNLTGKLPVAGMGLGCLLLARALGAETRKLPNNHQGCNQPVRDLSSGKVDITTQNHLFSIVTDSLPEGAKITAINLNDDTVATFTHIDKPLFGVLYQPISPTGDNQPTNFYNMLVQTIKDAKAGKYNA